MLKLFFDGGCRPNPGRMEIAVVMRGRLFLDRDIGTGDAMAAEWLALLAAARLALADGAPDAVLLGDALAVIQQASGRVRATGAGVQHLATLRALAPGLRLRHIKRSQNLAGIALKSLSQAPERR